MRQIIHPAAVVAFLVLGACASEPDHFYTLNVLPDGQRGALTSPTIHVVLGVDVPVLVDRPEMVLATTDNGITVLDHQRWAVPLSEQVLQILARDIERQRSDVLVADRSFDQGTAPPVKITVDIVRLTARRAGEVHMEAHWRIVDAAAGMDQVGGDVFDSPVNGNGYDSIAQAYSRIMSVLADRLVAGIHSR